MKEDRKKANAGVKLASPLTLTSTWPLCLCFSWILVQTTFQVMYDLTALLNLVCSGDGGAFPLRLHELEKEKASKAKQSVASSPRSRPVKFAEPRSDRQCDRQLMR